jgi:hypothetical protein
MGKPELTEFGYGFEFSPISKDGVGAGNEDIDTRPVYIKIIFYLF